MLVDTSMGMILPTSPALDTTKNRRTVDNAFKPQVRQVVQMIRKPDRAPTPPRGRHGRDGLATARLQWK
ncbi:hypothetical protein Xmar_11570 [Xanthomonas axonopodis pv. martyniicola]|nr:hypothetical protein Xmar_11570 [Xanthomonas axonopodis pv. martyniicola]OOW90881.1 hypothetical protein Xvtr_17700 [Xanthomonas campestris pv. vitiscarnosae]PPT69911.1 hypothetical protein XarbCFBP8150_10335 [Xanthomonas arboricola]